MQDLTDRIGGLIDAHLRPVFKGKPKITVLVRFEDDPMGDCDVLVTSDTDEGVRALVERRTTGVYPLLDDALWGRVERYADAVCEYNRALMIDVGVDGAGAECKLAESALRHALAVPHDLHRAAEALAAAARAHGTVLTIEQAPAPGEPLAMGRHVDVVSVREARWAACGAFGCNPGGAPAEQPAARPAACGLMPLIEDYAKAVHDGDDAACGVLRTAIEASLEQEAAQPAAPIDMVLHCPACGKQHIDAPEWADDPHDIEQGRILGWTNEPHRSHLCHRCGHIWRPADVPTNGVAAVKTRGKADSPVATGAPANPIRPEDC